MSARFDFPPQLYAIGISLALVLLVSLRMRGFQRPLPPQYVKPADSSDKPWVAYAKSARRLGPLISLPRPRRPFGAHIIVVNSPAAANDLLDKRRTFACRPRSPMSELTGRQNNVGFSYYSDRLQRMRRVLHASLNVQAVERLWGGLIEEHSVGLVQAISTYRSEDGDSISEIVERNVQELIVSLTYGHKPDEEYIRVARGVMTDTMKGLQPSRWMVDIIPALKRVPGWMPGAGFKRWAADARELFNKMTGVPFDGVKAEMARGDAGPSFVMFSLEGLPVNHSKEDEDIVRFSAGSLFSAGSDTTAGVLLTFILLMTLHEAVQDRAHAEITSVLGPWHHLPALSDQPSLPYIDAIVQEVHRFHPAVPLATHSNYAEEEYEGQRVPKKSWILANIWSMVHDEALYPNPDVFDPDRFLSKGGVEPQTDPRTFTFGFGRRRCAGQHLANASLYLYIARMLTLYRLLPELDKDGTASPPPLEFETAFVPTPKPFRCRFVLREGAAEILAHLHPQR